MNIIKKILSLITGKSQKPPTHEIEKFVGQSRGYAKTDHLKAIALAINKQNKGRQRQ